MLFNAKTFSLSESFTMQGRKSMTAENIKTNVKLAVDSAVQFSKNRKDASTVLAATKQEAISKQKLWKEGNKSKLIKLGIAIMVFPEPTPVCEIVGAGFVAAGVIQKGIKSRAIYMEDIPKNLKKTFKEINSLRL
jgi:hypothetical protein